jgi:hypothetical protein
MTDAITIRRSTLSDQTRIMRLAALDDRPAPHGDALLAFVGGDLRAVLGVAEGRIVADPFHLTQELVDLLQFRAEQERNGRNGRRRGSAGRRMPIRPVEAAA